MISQLWLENVAACAVQSTLVIAAGAALAHLLRIQQGRAAFAAASSQVMRL